MTRKKKAPGIDVGQPTARAESPSTNSVSTPSTETTNGSSIPPQPSTSALIICRNKHWRYISSFHGPWLQLPPEILESLALSNYRSPRPRPINPDVFFDIVKVRRLIEDATDLAVRAANGTTSAALSTSMSGSNSMFGAGVAALGLGSGASHGHAKLSRERKHRMRELATQKLSSAYQLDEIAASVAMMQGASSLEDVAKMVLQRSQNDPDAKYVHFFHEKIPSRMMAECTDLSVLDDVIRNKSLDAPLLRTRAVTRLFKDDFQGALQDLTDALRSYHHTKPVHEKEKDWQITEHSKSRHERSRADYDAEGQARLEEHGFSESLELQLLFHRAGVYLSLASLNVEAALKGLGDKDIPAEVPKTNGHDLMKEEVRRLEAQKAVKMNAKRALRDYLAFLSHLEYTPGLTTDAARALFTEMNDYVHEANRRTSTVPTGNKKRSSDASGTDKPTSDMDIHHIAQQLSERQKRSSDPYNYPVIPTPKIYQVSEVFSPVPPPDVPTHASNNNELVTSQTASQQRQHDFLAQQIQAYIDRYESVTYHPLLTDALHSLLLCHCLIQTPAKELLRHAHMVARLTRYSDGYPVFLAARSPSRSDWIQLLQYTGNWIGLTQSWEDLCAPAPIPGEPTKAESKNTPGQARERRRYDAIAEALADERVHDAQSFQAVLSARDKGAKLAASDIEQQQQQQQQQQQNGNGGDAAAASGPPKKIVQDEGRDYLLGTERARAIARWISEAPQVTVAGTKRGGKAKSGRAGAKKGPVAGNGGGVASQTPNGAAIGNGLANGNTGVVAHPTEAMETLSVAAGAAAADGVVA